MTVSAERPNAADRAVVVSLGHRRFVAEQARRRALVRRSLLATLEAIVVGLDGHVPLEEAVCAADERLRPAVSELLKSELAS